MNRRQTAIATAAFTLLISACATASYAPPQTATVLTFQRVVAGKADRSASGVFTHSILRASGDETLYRVTDRTEGPRDEVRLYRGLFSYAYWRPGQGWVEYRFDRAKAGALWPLEPGKAVTFEAVFGFGAARTEKTARARWRATERGSMTWAVLRRELTSVPAGTYRTVVIRREQTFRELKTGSVVRQIRTSWYAPSLGWIVKQSIETYHRPGPAAPERKSSASTMLLTKVSPPGR